MKRLIYLRVLLIIPMLLLPLASVTSVQAKGPDFFAETIDFTGPVDNPCGFEIVKYVYGTLHYQIFFDKDGMVIRWHENYGQVNETWSANNKLLNLQVSGDVHYKIISATEVIQSMLGTYVFITVPGYGRVYGQAGNFSYKWDFTSDPWIFIKAVKEVGAQYIEDWDPICDYLGS